MNQRGIFSSIFAVQLRPLRPPKRPPLGILENEYTRAHHAAESIDIWKVALQQCVPSVLLFGSVFTLLFCGVLGACVLGRGAASLFSGLSEGVSTPCQHAARGTRHFL